MSEVNDPKLLEQLNDPSHAISGGDPQIPQSSMKIGDPVDLLHGVMQGLIDPIEGITQLAEKSTGWTLAPESVKNWAREYRNRARSTAMGIGGEVVGNIAPALMFPGTTAASLGERAIAGAVAGGAQPVSGGGDYWRTKADQAVGGAIGGAIGPGAIGAGARAAPFLMHPKTAIMHWLRGHASPTMGALAQRAAGLPGGTYGALIGEEQGRRPVGEPSGRLYITPQDRPQPAPPPAPPAPRAPPAVANDDDAPSNFSQRFSTGTEDQ